MRIETDTKEQRIAWFNAARDYLKKALKAKPVEYNGRKIASVNEMYEHVLGINVNAGKSIARQGRTTPTAAHIHAIRSFFPGIDQAILDMEKKPAEIQRELDRRIFEAKEIRLLQEIEGYKARIRELEEANGKLISILEKMQSRDN